MAISIVLLFGMTSFVWDFGIKTDVMLVWLLVRETLFGKDKAARAGGFSEGSFVGYYDDGRVMDSNHIPEKYYRDLVDQ